MPRQSQNAGILAALKEGARITPMGALRRFGCFRLIRRRDPMATIGEISEFRRKMVRLLAFNYDVHRRPDPALNKRLMPADRPGAEPIIYPPEWKEAKTA